MTVRRTSRQLHDGGDDDDVFSGKSGPSSPYT